MDLDALIAKLSAAAAPALAELPLLAAEDYVPTEHTSDPSWRDGSQQLFIGLLGWLVARNGLRSDLQRAWNGQLATADSLLAFASRQLNFKIGPAELTDEFLPFCRAYCAPTAGGYSSDYHDLFVEGTSLDSFADVRLDSRQLKTLAEQIESRFQAFTSGDPQWDQALVRTPAEATATAPLPASFSAWQRSIHSFENLMSESSSKYKARSASYLEVVDQAALFREAAVADELLATYLWCSDASLQAAVWRALHSRPVLEVARALINRIGDLVSRTGWAPELVDVFDDDLPDTQVDAISEWLLAAETGVRSAFVSALAAAERQGSSFAPRLLQRLYPDEA